MKIVDYNLDGRQDVAYYSTDVNDRGWRIVLAEPYGNAQWRLNANEIATPLLGDVTFVDADSDGTQDAVYATQGTFNPEMSIRRLLHPASNGPPVSSDRYYEYAAEYDFSGIGGTSTVGQLQSIAPDFNGDGRVDILLAGNGDICDQSNPDDCTTYYNAGHAMTMSGIEDNSPSVSSYYRLSGTIIQGVSHSPVADQIQVLDINNDGLSDLFFPISTPTQDPVQFHLRINKGDGTFEPAVVLTDSSMMNPHADVQMVDWNMDGHEDVLWRDRFTSSGRIMMRVWRPDTGTFQQAQLVTTDVTGNNDETVQFFDVNGDAVPDLVRLNRNGNIGSGEVQIRKVGNNPANVAVNRISAVTNGLGATTTIDYEPLSTSDNYERLEVVTTTGSQTVCEFFGPEEACYEEPIQVTDKDSFYTAINGPWDYPSGWQTLGKNSPIIEFSGPHYVVTKVTADAPATASSAPGNVVAGATSAIEYFYGEAKIQAAGRGFLGFERMSVVDQQSNISTTTRYRQDWPFLGRPVATGVETSSGMTLSTSTVDWEILEWDSNTVGTAATGTANLGPIHIVRAADNEKAYDLAGGGTAQGTLLSDVTTTVTYDAESNAEDITIVTEDSVGELKRVVTANTYFGGVGQPQTFDLFDARLNSTTVTTTYEGQTTVRSAEFEYYPSGVAEKLLHKEILEPSSFAITTEHFYDDFGNIEKSTVAAGGETRCNAITSDYDAEGRYVDETFDCLGRKTSSVTWRNHYGAPTDVETYVDIGGQSSVTTRIAYSDLGRAFYTYTEDGSSTTEYPTSDLSNCPVPLTAVKSIVRTGAGAESQVCSDKLGREIRTLTKGFDGAWNAQDTEYDNRGRVVFTSEPYDLGSSCSGLGCTAYWTEVNYDLLGRPLDVELPDGSITRTSYAFYTVEAGRVGLRTVVTAAAGSPLAQSKTEVTNAAGLLADTIDNNNGRTKFTYDGQGNLKVMVDALGNTTTMDYDILGRKIELVDPDKGTWTYDHNGFGEIVEQTDAKSQIQVMDYDGLGRMICRRDRTTTGLFDCDDPASGFESASTWTYDTAANGLGQLATVTDAISGYTRVLSYDSLGRAVTANTTIDSTTYTEETNYDEVGRVYRVFDAAGDGALGNKGVKHDYNAHGYLEKVSDASGSTVYRQITAMNARGQVTSEQLGNGSITTANTHYPDTGRLSDIDTTRPGGTVQDLHYDWDTLGNLTLRNKVKGSTTLSETFKYEDGMNRLTEYTAGGATVTMTYDAIGNLKTKSDVSSSAFMYGQGSAGPHAVTSAGGATYTYDDNGNNETGDGRTINYTVFDKPYQIAKGGDTVDFSYGPERNRYKRIDAESGAGSETKTYVGNVEFVERADGTKARKRYIAGVAIESIEFDSGGNLQSQSTAYTFRDHLGSMDVITDSSGVILKEFSFDSWGQRRDASDWTPFNSTELTDFDKEPTTRGFTDHEMVDKVGIIHMNGRIYDHKIGRFLQADPFIQDPSNSRSLNRYSYVQNNPLNATDPSGYFLAELITYSFFASYAEHLLNRATAAPPPAPKIGSPSAGAGTSSAATGSSIAIAAENSRDLFEWINAIGKAAALARNKSGSNQEGQKHTNAATSPSFGATFRNWTYCDTCLYNPTEAFVDAVKGVPYAMGQMVEGAGRITLNGLATFGWHMHNAERLEAGLPPLPGSAPQVPLENVIQAEGGPVLLAITPIPLGQVRLARVVPKGASGLDDLARFRSELGLLPDEGTIARLDVGGRNFYGINAHGQATTLRTNAITRTHAEADAFQQAANAGVSGGRGRLFVDRELCRACGQNGGVRSMMRQLELDELEVVTPSGTQLIRP